jgi:colanic acid biosynthesis glycosyl transferase WcaI
VKVLILNQYAPPDPSPTAVLAGEIARLLEQQGHEGVCLSGGGSYAAGRGGWRRWANELLCLGRMLVAGLTARGVGAVVVMTSPPCALLVGVLVAGWHRARLIHWVMDLYPETAVALGECGPGLGKVVGALMAPAYRRCALVIALDGDMADRLRQSYGVKAAVLPPWPPAQCIPAPSPAGAELRSGERRIWMYSGNLGRAHDWETLLGAQEILEKDGGRWELVFQGGGAGYREAQARAEKRGLRHCRSMPYAKPGSLVESLLAADVLVATRRPALRGLLWPSKLALLQTLPRPLVWVGETEGAVAQFLREREATAAFASGDSRGLADWLQALAPSGRTLRPPTLDEVRQKAGGHWLGLMANALK